MKWLPNEDSTPYDCGGRGESRGGRGKENDVMLLVGFLAKFSTCDNMDR